jgi:hypothetical protein
MSRQQRPTRAILAKDPERRLAAIIRRHGGESRTIKSDYYVPEPPRVPCRDLFADDQLSG